MCLLFCCWVLFGFGCVFLVVLCLIVGVLLFSFSWLLLGWVWCITDCIVFEHISAYVGFSWFTFCGFACLCLLFGVGRFVIVYSVILIY